MVKKNKDDSQGEILYQKKDQNQEAVRPIPLKESPHVAQQGVGDNQRTNTLILKITSRLDQRMDGVPKFQVEKDAIKRKIICESHSSSVTVFTQNEVDGIIISAKWTRVLSDERRSERHHRETSNIEAAE